LVFNLEKNEYIINHLIQLVGGIILIRQIVEKNKMQALPMGKALKKDSFH
jgi:hypothetical protein